MALQPGDTLDRGKYHIIRQLGRGGFGFVYLADNTLLHEQVALKELIPALVGDEAMLKRFLAEARATMRLTHERIVRTYDVFAERDNYYIVMEYMPGSSLESRLQEQGALSVDEAVHVAADVAEGLSYAHEHGVVHCDLKPANILFTADGHAKVADFGIAHISDATLTRSWLTPAGFVGGTLPYMSPEQADGVRDDRRIDIYAVGAVLYQMLTGRTYLDFDQRETPGAQADNVYRLRNQPASPPSVHNRCAPTWLDAVVLKALAKQPEGRYPGAGAMRAALLAGEGVVVGPARDAVGSTVLASRPKLATSQGPRPEASPAPGRRRRNLPAWVWPSAVAGGVLLAAIAVALLWGGPKPMNQFDPTRTTMALGTSLTPGASTIAAPQPTEVDLASTNLPTRPPSPSATPRPEVTLTPTPTPIFTPTPVASPTPNFAQMTITNGPVNVRSGPGTGYPKIGDARDGATYRITGKNEAGDWYQFSFGEDQPGWVSARFTTVDGPTDALAIVKPAAAPAASQSASATTTLSLLPTGGYFGYGTQAQVYGGADLGYIANANRSMGFNWVKFEVPWKDLEGSKGSYGWGGMDTIVNNLAGAGQNILASIVKAPDWSRPANTDRGVDGPPANPQDYADFVGAYAARYKGKVKTIEIWNGQNLWYEWGHEPLDVGRYVTLLCKAYQAIKAADPGMVVVTGAMVSTGVNDGSTAIDDVVYLQLMYAAGAEKCFDAIGAHPAGCNNPPDAKYGYSNPAEPSFKNHPSFFFRDTMERYRQVMVANSDAGKRIWPTEFGWASTSSPLPGYEYARDVTPEEQAQYIVQAYQLAKTWGWVGPMFLSNLNFGITNPGTALAAFGIAGRPAFDALARMPK